MLKLNILSIFIFSGVNDTPSFIKDTAHLKQGFTSVTILMHPCSVYHGVWAPNFTVFPAEAVLIFFHFENSQSNGPRVTHRSGHVEIKHPSSEGSGSLWSLSLNGGSFFLFYTSVRCNIDSATSELHSQRALFIYIGYVSVHRSNIWLLAANPYISLYAVTGRVKYFFMKTAVAQTTLMRADEPKTTFCPFEASFNKSRWPTAMIQDGGKSRRTKTTFDVCVCVCCN